MKGIVVEINKKDAVILSDEGIFSKVNNMNYTVGQAIDVRERRKTYPKRVAGAAGLAAAFAVCTIGAYAWFTPTDYVSMDVNPSVEYTLNTFERVLEVKGVNDDGKELIESLDLSNMSIEDAVKATLDSLMAGGYLTDDPNGGVVITTSGGDQGDAEQLAEELEQKIQSYLDDQEGVTAEVDAEAVAPERVEMAKELGVTPGKLKLVEKLQASTTGAVSVEEWLAKPVKEINKAIKENRKAAKSDKEVNGEPGQKGAAAKDVVTDTAGGITPEVNDPEEKNDNGNRKTEKIMNKVKDKPENSPQENGQPKNALQENARPKNGHQDNGQPKNANEDNAQKDNSRQNKDQQKDKTVSNNGKHDQND